MERTKDSGTLLAPRWVAGHVLVVVLAVIFVLLGLWQLGRDHHKQTVMRERRAALAAPAPPLGAHPVTEQRYELRGTYDPAHEIVLRNQLHGKGDDGVDVLTPLRLADGRVVLVDRGWVAGTGETLGPSSAPSGPVTVRGTLHGSRALSPQDAVTTIGGRLAVPRVDTAAIGEREGTALQPVWLRAESQDPAPGANAPALPEPLPPDQVNHMQYAIEWFAFALIPLIGWPIVLVRVRRRRASDSPEPAHSSDDGGAERDEREHDAHPAGDPA